ncbi:MAG: AmmeMemoRadiSam system protein B [Desulfobacterales bacterium]|nr:AmmeMemoRadiSam system protein B [Desulfobacterales bacterium]MBF0397409.1 AmmeMemoRadiSam system protein B [Desulfobacterales bacterium]
MSAQNLKKAKFAGSWYPKSDRECKKDIENYLSLFNYQNINTKELIGGIVPHAGWYFSGQIACRVISLLKSNTPTDIIIIFGMHLGQNSSVYLMKEGAFETPFGDLFVDSDIANQIGNMLSFKTNPIDNYVQDNTIELQLPFIKYFFGEAKIIAMGVPANSKAFQIGKKVAELIKSKGLNAKVIGSTDLTHYGINYDFMPQGTGKASVDWVRSQNDKKVIDQILALNSENIMDVAIENQNACCPGAVSAAVSYAKEMGAVSASLVEYATSYDKQPNNSFVGYVGIVF